MTILASALGAAALLFAAITDVMRRTIPDRAVLLVALAGIALRTGDGASAVLIAIVLAVIIFAGMLVLFHFQVVGGGDVKLLAAASLLLPSAKVPGQLLLIALVGGVMAALWLVDRRLSPTRGLSADSDVAFPPSDREPPQPFGFQGHGLPYGVAICLGTFAGMALNQ